MGGQVKVLLAAVVLLSVPATAAAQKTYPIVVESTPPGANVFIDDRSQGPVGVTPYEGRLTAGDHVMVVELSGYETAVQDFTVKRSSKPQTFTVELEEVPAVEVEVFASADDAARGATILLDGVEVGTVPATIEASVGPHQIQVVKEGLPTFEEWIEVAPGESSTVIVTMGRAGDAGDAGDPEPQPEVKQASAPTGPRALLSAGVAVAWRDFRYDAPRNGPLRPFDADQVGLAAFDLELYPALGWDDITGLEHLVVTGSYAYGFPLESSTMDGMEAIETVWNELELGVSARFPSGKNRIDLDAAFGRVLFTFRNAGTLGDELPDVDYRFLRFGAGVSHDTGTVELFAGADIMAPLSTGPLADRFGGATVIGFAASGGALVRLYRSFYGRLAASWCRWGYGFASESGDPFDADGAGDTMYGVTFSGAYRF
jgi:hypothetical protein